MIEKQANSLRYFEFPNFSDHQGVAHGLFTRNGGSSQGAFQGLNMSLTIGDNAVSVYENRAAVCGFFHGERLVTLKQVHGTEVFCYEKQMNIDNDQVEADAVLTDEKGVLLLIQTADCQAVMLHDPVKGVVGNIHAGWRGSVAGIIGKTIRTMTKRYGSRAQDILAGVGPSLGPCCAEFVNYATEIPESLWIYKDNRHYFDFWAISQNQLEEEGVNRENICLSRLCTVCNKDLFFSFRRDKLTGRLANVIGLI